MTTSFSRDEGLLSNQGKQARDGSIIVLHQKKCCTTPIVFCTTLRGICTTLNPCIKIRCVFQTKIRSRKWADFRLYETCQDQWTDKRVKK